jgi:hypothetical protein
MRGLTDAHYPDAEQISVVLDNLRPTPLGPGMKGYLAPEAHRILRGWSSTARPNMPAG